MSTEWRANMWLLVELLVVSVVLWYINDFMYIRTVQASQDYGFDYERVYRVNYRIAGIDGEADPDSVSNHLVGELERRLAARPDIEAVARTAYATPFETSGYNAGLFNPEDTTACLGFSYSTGVSMRYGFVTPGYFSVLRISGINGESPARLDSVIAAGGAVLSDNVVYHEAPGMKSGKVDVHSLIGKRYYTGEGALVTVGAVMKSQLRTMYESVRKSSQVYVPLGRDMMSSADLLVRLKDNASEADFLEALNGKGSGDYSVGRLYLCGVQPLSAIKSASAAEVDRTMRLSVLAMSFLMVNVFLGLLGAFWFRTQRRSGEIAIRMVGGATSRDIICRVISEAWILLLVATIPALGIDWLIGKADLLISWERSHFSLGRFWIAAVITFVEMTVMVVLGTFIPAYRAMKTKPSVVLQAE